MRIATVMSLGVLAISSAAVAQVAGGQTTPQEMPDATQNNMTTTDDGAMAPETTAPTTTDDTATAPDTTTMGDDTATDTDAMTDDGAAPADDSTAQ